MPDSPKRRFRDLSRSSTTLISEGASFNGVISGDSDFLVNGSVEGNCDVNGTVTIAESGSWSGSIVAGHVIVAGRVSGDIMASGQVEIGPTAHIEGVVTGEKIAVAEGAVVDGEMKTRGQDEPLSFSEKRSS